MCNEYIIINKIICDNMWLLWNMIIDRFFLKVVLLLCCSSSSGGFVQFNLRPLCVFSALSGRSAFLVEKKTLPDQKAALPDQKATLPDQVFWYVLVRWIKVATRFIQFRCLQRQIQNPKCSSHQWVKACSNTFWDDDVDNRLISTQNLLDDWLRENHALEPEKFKTVRSKRS